MTLLASVVFFISALLIAGLAAALFVRAGRREQQEGMMLRMRAAAGDDAAALAPAARIANPVVRAMCYVLWRSGLEVDPATVGRSLWVFAALLPIALLLFGLLAGVLVVGLLLTVGYLLLMQRAVKRRALIIEQMPGYLEGVIRVLSAGNTLEESLAAAAREIPEPAHGLFMSVGRQTRLGAPVEQVLAETAEIHQLRDLKVLALAAAINRKYGGSLRNILKSLMGAIRARDVAHRELRALTAETRFSAWVLALIPASLTIYIYIQNRAYYSDMWTQPGGRAALILALVLQGAGMLVLVRMMRTAEDPDA